MNEWMNAGADWAKYGWRVCNVSFVLLVRREENNIVEGDGLLLWYLLMIHYYW